MQTQIVVPICTTFNHNWIELYDRFRFRADRPLQWLQRICFWILTKIRAFAMEDTVTMQAVKIDTTKIIECIAQQDSNILSLYHYQGDRVLMGAKQFNTVVGDVTLSRMIHFEAPYQITDYSKQPPYKLLGMKVTVVPWMDGILVVPKGMN